jgi:hypothetical protein
MQGNITTGRKRCPLCKRVYPEANNFCRKDGSRLEPTAADCGVPIVSDYMEEQSGEELIDGSLS